LKKIAVKISKTKNLFDIDTYILLFLILQMRIQINTWSGCN